MRQNRRDNRNNARQALAANQPDAPNIDALRHELADLIELHPPEDWPVPLLLAVNGVLAAYALGHGLHPAAHTSGPPLRLVT